MPYKLLVKRDASDARTGMREWDVLIIERDDADQELGRSPLRTFGVDTESVRKLYGAMDDSCYQQYLVEKVKPEMVAFYEQWKAGRTPLTGQEL